MRAARWSWILLCAGTASAAIHFDTFAALEPGLSLAGDASIEGSVLQLTPAEGDRAGAAWYADKQSVGAGFETTFQFQLTRQGGLGKGADGFAFVLQNSGPNALGGRGSAGGFAVSDRGYHHDRAGIPWSIAVFFDTFKNGNEGDPSANYVSFCTYGQNRMNWPAPRLAFTQHLPFELKDKQVHTARIVFRPPILSVYLDGVNKPVLTSPVDLSIIVDSEGKAWVGFTASTGGGYEKHDILNWSFNGADVSSDISVVSSQISFATSECLPNRNLCTPERSFVESSDGKFHVILPANVEWGASIPNPANLPVQIISTRGIVCWDAQSRGLDGCSGPSGNAPASPGFIKEDVPAGALITENHGGRTWFSVNGRKGALQNNEGFYEFDVVIEGVK